MAFVRAGHFELTNVLGKSIPGSDATSPSVAVGVETNLIRFGSVNSFEPYSRVANDDRVAINDTSRARSINCSISAPGFSPALISRKLVHFMPCMALREWGLHPVMGSGCNERCFDLCFQLLSKLNWQFDVCSPASSVCDGQHNRAMVCGSGGHIAHLHFPVAKTF
jgi:hypothetical protein